MVEILGVDWRLINDWQDTFEYLKDLMSHLPLFMLLRIVNELKPSKPSNELQELYKFDLIVISRSILVLLLDCHLRKDES